jgi:hypothetical protein
LTAASAILAEATEIIGNVHLLGLLLQASNLKRKSLENLSSEDIQPICQIDNPLTFVPIQKSTASFLFHGNMSLYSTVSVRKNAAEKPLGS